MSSEGIYRISLRRQIEEQLRRQAERQREERFRREADELIEQCDREMMAITSRAEQVVAREELRSAREALDRARASRSSKAEAARDSARRALGIVQRIRDQVHLKAAAWSAERNEGNASAAATAPHGR